MRPNSEFHADLVTFTEEIHNEKIHLLCSFFFYVQFQFSKIFVNYPEILE